MSLDLCNMFFLSYAAYLVPVYTQLQHHAMMQDEIRTQSRLVENQTGIARRALVEAQSPQVQQLQAPVLHVTHQMPACTGIVDGAR